MNATEWEALFAVRQQLLRAGHGQKARVTQEAAKALGCSVATLYRRLEEAGLETGRRRRADAGQSAMSEVDLARVGGMLFHSRRENDKQLLSVEDAIDILSASGQLDGQLSPGRVGQLLRTHHVHPQQLAQAKPATELRSLHPNHVWQLDSSTCVLYYMRSGHLASMDADQFYRNKPQNMARVLHDLCTRYAVADHTSGAFKFRYHLGGESAQNLVDFFLWAVTKQDASPMHGVPLIVMLDKGSGNTSSLFANLARRMQVRVIHHAAGNPRATGSVEKTHDIIERHFEGRFRFMPRQDLTLEGINTFGEEWAAAHCATRQHSRHGATRYGVWMQITAEQLRVPASPEILRELVTSEPESRRVDNTKQISFSVRGHGSRTYDVGLVPGVEVGGKVMVVVNAYRAPAIDVRWTDPATGEELWQTVEPIERNAFGFDVSAPVIGEQLRTAAHTAVDAQRNRITQEAYRQPGEALPSLEEAARARKRHEQAYAGVVDAKADVRATPVPSYLPRRGTPLETPVPRLTSVLLPVVEAVKRLKPMLGPDFGPHVYPWVMARYGQVGGEGQEAGVPEDQLQAIAEQLKPAQPVVKVAAAGGLRIVGGEA